MKIKRVMVKLGDIWQCGDHRVMCGDSTDQKQVSRLCGLRSPMLLLTDPPYGVGIGEINIKRPRHIGVKAKLKNDALDTTGIRSMWAKAFKAATMVLDTKASFCVFSAQGPLMMAMVEELANAGLEYRHQWIWMKPVFRFGQCDRHYQHEPIMYGWRKGGSHRWTGDRKLSSVLQYGPDAKGFGHPTVKPKALLMDLMMPLTLKGETVLDPFIGSGSAMLACELSGRRCLGMELDPKFASMSVNRWQNFTGKKAVRER